MQAERRSRAARGLEASMQVFEQRLLGERAHQRVAWRPAPGFRPGERRRLRSATGAARAEHAAQIVAHTRPRIASRYSTTRIEARHGADEFGRHAADVEVVGVHPVLHLLRVRRRPARRARGRRGSAAARVRRTWCPVRCALRLSAVRSRPTTAPRSAWVRPSSLPALTSARVRTSAGRDRLRPRRLAAMGDALHVHILCCLLLLQQTARGLAHCWCFTTLATARRREF